jgi:CxxC motif-containing protein (DUF1111 family)
VWPRRNSPGNRRRRAVGPPPPPAAPPQQPAGQSFANLAPSLLALFNAGRRQFGRLQTIDDGLGPVFNGRSCGECHNAPAPGGGSERLVTRIGTITNGRFDPLTSSGGSLLQNRGLNPQLGSTHAFRGENVPPNANLALGMQTVGKFGWKAQVPTLFQFAGDAYLNEQGITNPFFPNENCPSGNCNELQFNPRPGLNDGGEDTRAVTDFMTLLAAPPRGPIASDEVFNRIGCNACHVATLQTGSNMVASLNRVTYSPYSDFLLHDMGALGDGIAQGAANGREIRTAPLWGLRFVTTYLHDGRTRTLEGAIAAHDGQGRAARERFNALNATDRTRLLAFLRSL